ncbi:unnamed protein product [Brassica oleracea var. botrytis]
MLDDEDDNGEGETVVIRSRPTDVEDVITHPPEFTSRSPMVKNYLKHSTLSNQSLRVLCEYRQTN